MRKPQLRSCTRKEWGEIIGTSIIRRTLTKSTLLKSPRDSSLERKEAEEIANAYLFGLCADTSLVFIRTSRTKDEGTSELVALEEPRVRPLLLGPGMAPVVSEYIRALAVDDLDFKMLPQPEKVIEFAPSTVIRQKSHDEIRRTW